MTMTYKRSSLLRGCACCEPATGFASTAVNRRRFLAGGAAVGLGMAGLGTGRRPSRPESRTGSTSTTTSCRRRSAR